jgi:hypothetical protein
MHTNYLCESQIEEMKFNINHHVILFRYLANIRSYSSLPDADF